MVSRLQPEAGDIGSGIAGLSCSELTGGLALVALIAGIACVRPVMIIGALAVAAAVAYETATLASHTIHATANGQLIDNLIGARITPAWGAWGMLLVAAVAAIASLRHSGPQS